MSNLKQQLEEFRKKYGDWTAHVLRLGQDVYTMNDYNENHLLYLKRVLQMTADLCKADLNGLRVLDLACLEGGFAVEMALHGAEVVAVEGRRNNLAKLKFARDYLGLKKIEVVLDDVRNVNKERLGSFDCVLCLGILYHLDQKSLVPFLQNIFEMTSSVAIIDTHISLHGGESFMYNGKRYFGAVQSEHPESATYDQIQAQTWSSLDNRISFYMTESSLCNLLADLGFSSVLTCEMPYYHITHDRRTFAALKGSPLDLRSFDLPIALSNARPEQPDRRVVEPINQPRVEPKRHPKLWDLLSLVKKRFQ